VKFECTRCGECCYGDWWTTGAFGLMISKNELERLALTLAMGLDEFKAKYAPNGMIRVQPHCSLFDPELKSCIANDGKPDGCRKWPYLQQILKNPAHMEKAARLCPGITLEPGDLPSLPSGD
jgi:Fe-S-cluster containining protein